MAGILTVLRGLTRDSALLFLTRFTRLFSYGALSVVLVFYLTSLGPERIANRAASDPDPARRYRGLAPAHHPGRPHRPPADAHRGGVAHGRRGPGLRLHRNFLFLLAAGTIGVISPSGNEVGPFLPIEQAALSQVVPAASRTDVFAWYTLAGSLATAAGSLAGGLLTQTLEAASRDAARERTGRGSAAMPRSGLLLALFFRA